MFKKIVKILRIEFNNHIDEVLNYLFIEFKGRGWKEINKNEFKVKLSNIKTKLEKLENKIYLDIWSQDFTGYIVPYNNFFLLGARITIDSFKQKWIKRLKKQYNDLDYKFSLTEIEGNKSLSLTIIITIILTLIIFIISFIIDFKNR